MSLEKTKRILQSYKITPNKVLGQNFLIEPSLYPKLCIYADLGKSDVVLDAGAGLGWLTHFLAERCKAVVAVEKDPQVVSVLREHTKNSKNITVIEGDVLLTALPMFNKIIAAPPYYLSSSLITWLLERKLDCAILILQIEFAARLVASIGSNEYSWLTVVTNHLADIELLDPIPRSMFYPSPEVDSIIVSLKPKVNKQFETKDPVLFERLVKWLFTQRNKKLSKAIEPFIRDLFKITKQEANKLSLSLPYYDKRPRNMAPEDFGAVVNALVQ
jgi:16S rRNA (adenine1518-N6/adenine1519-N6)-dimethyltransferase